MYSSGVCLISTLSLLIAILSVQLAMQALLLIALPVRQEVILLVIPVGLALEECINLAIQILFLEASVFLHALKDIIFLVHLVLLVLLDAFPAHQLQFVCSQLPLQLLNLVSGRTKWQCG